MNQRRRQPTKIGTQNVLNVEGRSGEHLHGNQCTV